MTAIVVKARPRAKTPTAKTPTAKTPTAKTPRAKTAGKNRARASAPLSLQTLVERSLDDDKAEDIVVVDLQGKSSIADFMIIASGRSQRQLGAMAEHVAAKLKSAGVRHIGIEGGRNSDWVLIDGGDVVVHLFRPEVRLHYNLEKMWGMTLPEPDRAAGIA